MNSSSLRLSFHILPNRREETRFFTVWAPCWEAGIPGVGLRPPRFRLSHLGAGRTLLPGRCARHTCCWSTRSVSLETKLDRSSSMLFSRIRSVTSLYRHFIWCCLAFAQQKRYTSTPLFLNACPFFFFGLDALGLKEQVSSNLSFNVVKRHYFARTVVVVELVVG